MTKYYEEYAVKLYELSACEILERIQTKKATVVDVVTSFIDRIKEVNPALNAIHQFEPKRILAEAEKKDQEIASGKKLGRLHGLPITLKDAFYAPGFRGAKGNVHFFAQSPTDKSAVAVQRLIKEGVIILGISNAPEFCAAFETDNSLHGKTNNPYDLARTPGGSSGGEAAIIASGGSCVGLGSDAGGSIRVPAHYSGISGLKPTKGLVPTTGNVPNDSGGLHTQLLTFGPLSRHAEDLELILSVIAGPDDGDPFSVPVALSSSKEVEVAKLKAVYFLDNGAIKPDIDTLEVLTNALKKLKPLLASLEEIKPPEILKETYQLVWDTCFLGGNEGKVLSTLFNKTGQHEFSSLYQRHLQNVKKSSFDNAELHNRIAKMHEYKQVMLKLMKDVDILLLPVAATPARLHKTTHDHLDDYTYAMTFNLTGWPAATINCGFSAEGLPIGIQIAAKPWQDHIVLAFAKAAQKVLGIPEVVSVPLKAKL